MNMVPALDNGGRWDHIASEAEVISAMRSGKPVVYEIPFMKMTYFVFREKLTTIRLGGTMGGDTRDIEGGYVYASDIQQRFDEQELRFLADHPMNAAF